MATTIEQKPLGLFIAAGQELMFTISNAPIYSSTSNSNVKYVAKVHISNEYAPNPNTTDDLVGTFKTTANNKGVGMFDLRNVVENYVAADNVANGNPTYKGVATQDLNPYPIHLIDKFSWSTNSVRWMAIQFETEYTDSNGDTQTNTPVNCSDYILSNAYIKYTDILTKSGVNFGYSMNDFIISGSAQKFLTNAPTTQYANLDDYGTVALRSGGTRDPYIRMDLEYFNSAGVSIGSEQVFRSYANGGWGNANIANETYDGYAQTQILFFGCFPGNLRNTTTSVFSSLVTAGTIQGGSIKVFAKGAVSADSQTYTIQLNCPTAKNYESIRLCWLNQWGAWDYYTFTKKSTRTISTQGTTYHQLAGSWNESIYQPNSYKGGTKAFRVNATEKITMNTDFVSEDDK